MKFTLDGNKFYRTKEWLGFREYVINKRRNNNANKLLRCEHCGNIIYNKADCILHHKEELTESNVNDLNISLNESNILVVHFNCHNEIHNRFGQGERHVYIVWGAPCAGKSRWVENVLHRDDLVVDMDLIYKMINPKNEMFDKSNRLTAVAFQVQKRLLEMIRDNYGMWQNAYIITTENIESQLERMGQQYNARLVHIDTDKTQCISNLFKDKRKENQRVSWIGYINNYFDEYEPPNYNVD